MGVLDDFAQMLVLFLKATETLSALKSQSTSNVLSNLDGLYEALGGCDISSGESEY